MRILKYCGALLLCISFLGCFKEKKRVSPSSPSLTKTVLTSSEGGKRIWRITTERIKIKNEKTYLYNVKFELFRDKEIECTITGDKGEISSDRITISGNVIGRMEDGGTLTTNSLIFEEKTSSLYTDDMVSFTKDHFLLKGQGFIANKNLSDIKIKKDVEVFFRN